ncbi:hypothetical protein [Nocardia tengchongensis]|uniref:hypothetical protein n=1 Tax=Nocardia tengchongensis TaxID=2055889 RepID=UPI00360855D9
MIGWGAEAASGGSSGLTIALALAAPAAAIIGAFIAARASRAGAQKSLSEQLATLATLRQTLDGLPKGTAARENLEESITTLEADIAKRKAAAATRQRKLDELVSMFYGAGLGAAAVFLWLKFFSHTSDQDSQYWADVAMGGAIGMGVGLVLPLRRWLE